MQKYDITAAQIRLAKLELDIAEMKAKQAKDKYENLRKQLTNDMISGNVFKFEINGDENMPGMSFRIESKDRWSPVVDNKDQLYDLLKDEAPELFTMTAAALTKYMNDLVDKSGELPGRFNGLVKKYEDTHVVVRTTNR